MFLWDNKNQTLVSSKSQKEREKRGTEREFEQIRAKNFQGAEQTQKG